MAAASPRKHLKIYNFRITNAILMKLTTIKYHHETFHLAENQGVTHRAQESVSFLASFLVISRTIYKTVLHMILCLAQHHWSKSQKNSTIFGGVILKKPPSSSLKSTFLVLRKHLKIHNLATTNAMIMKLARIMYLRETFHLAKNWGMTLRA